MNFFNMLLIKVVAVQVRESDRWEDEWYMLQGGQAESDSLGGRFIGSQGEVFLHVILARADIYILESVAKSSQKERLMHI